MHFVWHLLYVLPHNTKIEYITKKDCIIKPWSCCVPDCKCDNCNFEFMSCMVYCLAGDSSKQVILLFHPKLNTQHMETNKIKHMNIPIYQCTTYTKNTKIYSILIFTPKRRNYCRGWVCNAFGSIWRTGGANFNIPNKFEICLILLSILSWISWFSFHQRIHRTSRGCFAFKEVYIFFQYIVSYHIDHSQHKKNNGVQTIFMFDDIYYVSLRESNHI